MKSIYTFTIFFIIFFINLYSFDDYPGMPKPLFFPIDPDRIIISHNGSANRDFLNDIVQIGTSTQDFYPFSNNNWCMGRDEESNYTYIAFMDSNSLGDEFYPPDERIISYNIISNDGQPLQDEEGLIEPNFSGFPDLVLSATGRPYVSFYKNDGGYYSWLTGDTYNIDDTQILWHNKTQGNFDDFFLWPQIRITKPTDGSEGIIYMLAIDADEPYGKAYVSRVTPQVDLNGWLADPFYTFENTIQVINEEESILHPSLAVSDDGSIVGAVYRQRFEDQALLKYTYSTDEGATWSSPVNLAYDNSPCDVDEDGIIDGIWSVAGTGLHLFYNLLNEPCISYVKNVSHENGYFYPHTSKIYFGKIDIENEQLIERRVSDVIHEYDIAGGACSSVGHCIGANVSTYAGGQYIYMIWIDSRDMLAECCDNSEIYYAYSTDWGETWSQDVNLSNTQIGGDDFDEVFLTTLPEWVVNTTTGDVTLQMVFLRDHIPGGGPSDSSNQLSYNELYFYEYYVGNSIDNKFLFNKKPNASLFQNNPNPFNPVTNISYELGEAGVVSLSIYNVKGQLVKKLIDDEVKAPGSHSVVWDGRNSAGESAGSGVYFYKLKTNDSVLMKKMLLIK